MADGSSITAGGAALTAALVAAQRSGGEISALSFDPPASLAAAAQVQAEVARELGAEIAGWKFGFAPNSGVAISAPLFRNLVLPDGGRFRRGGASFLAVEAEIGFRLDHDFDAGDPLAALQTAFVGIEIVRSRLREAAKAPFPTFVADNIGNGGYVIGPGRDDWRQLDLAGLRCRVWADERLIHDAVGGHPQGDPSLPVRASAQQPIDRLGGLRAGQFVTTGSLCGVIPIDCACRIRVDLEHFGEVSVEIGD
jgi:2-keto-4-pentenoate hydratase